MRLLAGYNLLGAIVGVGIMIYEATSSTGAVVPGLIGLCAFTAGYLLAQD